MKKRLFLFAAFSLFIIHMAWSQRAALNPALYRAIRDKDVSSEMTPLLAQGDVTVIEEAIRSLGGRFKYSVSDIIAFTFPLDKVYALALCPGISRIEGLYGPGELMDDMTDVNSNIIPVHAGYAPLPQGYDGNGVVMAFLDSGIEWSHPDFQHADGTSRVRWLWDQTMSSGGTQPEEYGYGQEWDSTAINNGECTHSEWSGYFGHGSNVTGIGAGNGFAVNNFQGVAPASDIIAVSVSLNSSFLLNVADATKYAFDKAAEIGKPCVINASLGSYGGSHDGTDLAAQLIDDLIEEQNGRSFVCAAGNAGNIKFHLGYDAEADSSFTWFYYNNYTQSVFYEFWIDKDDASGFNFSFGADINSPYTYLGRTKYYNLETSFNYSNNVSIKKDTLYNNSIRIGIITITAYRYDSSYACDVSIKPDLTTYYWRFITQGSGRFDCWSSTAVLGTSDMISAIPDEATFPDIARYKLPDNNQTIVSSFSCSDKVITVGNYINRNVYIDYYGHVQANTDVVGALAPSTSFGPSRDGRIKPEISAPGNTTLTTGQFSTLYGLLIYQPYKVAVGGMHNRNGGTSMSSPVVAGVAALYLQKNPGANWKEIKAAITTTAKRDSITGFNLPDNKFGYGRVDAFAAMTTPIVLGCMDPFSVNFDPSATIDDGSCIPIVFGCNDTNALNYDSAATVNDGSCEYNVGVNSILNNDGPFYCYPNPSSGFTQFFFPQSNSGSLSNILITDVAGRVIDKTNITSSQTSWINHSRLDEGIYLCRLINGEHHSRILKLVVE
jgi:subtilisin family serine protease